MSSIPEAVPATDRVERRRAIRVRLSRDGLTTFLFLLPMLAVFGLFAWFPIVRALVMSVQKTNLVAVPTFVGLDNFARVLADPQFGIAVGNTAWFSLLALLFGFPVPIVLAVLMSEVRRRRGVYSALAYLPVVVPPVVSVLLWRFFYDASAHGVFNSILGWFGLGPLPWLQSSASAMPSIVIESTWANAGATVIIYLAALVSVRPELYDAADVDGASIRQKIVNITLPQLRSVLLLTLILQLIATAQVFTEPLLFTSGGPNNATLTVLLLIYRYAFQNSLGGDYGLAAALSLMLAAFLAVFTLGYYRLTRAWSESS
ncbi:MAG: multiple sugar transport system permease protein [Chloroflexota bacterium]|jgi:multiple sugar transport system permease protein|nr:multiple sugar transport system permease protein [Chloroflexota bacterium]